MERLAHMASSVVNGTMPCPECSDAGPHDDNGSGRMSDLSFCCRACGCHFDAEPTLELMAEEAL